MRSSSNLLKNVFHSFNTLCFFGIISKKGFSSMQKEETNFILSELIPPSPPNPLDFSAVSLPHLEKISQFLQIHNFSLPITKQKDSSFPTTSNSDWDFEKGVWKDHLSIHEEMNLPKPLHIFGYGSLCWNIAPELKSCKIKKAFVKGYRRKFWQISTDHRGTVDYPGLVVSLIPDEEYKSLTGFCSEQETICYGLAFEIPEGTENEVIRALDFREKGGYKRKIVKMYDVEEKKDIEGIVYLGEINNPHFAKKELRDDILECAKIIAVSEGESGKNSDYLRNLEGFLKINGFIDEYISLLSFLVQEYQNKGCCDCIKRIDEFCCDFSLFSEESNNKITIWIWNIYDSRTKKEHLKNFQFWLSSSFPSIDCLVKENSEYARNGIEMVFYRNTENLKNFDFHSLIRKFIFLAFENSEIL